MTIKINEPYFTGPGQSLFIDPNDTSKNLYVGNTINRQAFDTQFVNDLEKVLGINANRIYVTHVSKGTNHFTWEYTSVIVQFIVLERNSSDDSTLLESILLLNQMIQTSTSKLYTITNVTKDIDSSYGLFVRTWDLSLKLSYSIDIVGGIAVRENSFINLGSLGSCLTSDNDTFNYYCTFENYFINDISNALNISTTRLQVLFVKTAALDSVIIYFRIFPPPRGSSEKNATACLSDLISQVQNQQSLLYQGNVTIRVDPIWGVSNSNQRTRSKGPLFTYNHYEIDNELLQYEDRVSLYTAYDRCKANRRCNWGVYFLNQSANTMQYYHRLFDNGELFPVDLFVDFEDWRIGTRGWKQNNQPTDNQENNQSLSFNFNISTIQNNIRGAHLSPFDQSSIGPSIPLYLYGTNEGLVLDHYQHILDTIKQENFISYIQGKIEWINNNLATARMDSIRRSRADVREHMNHMLSNTTEWFYNEIEELKELNSSQCVYKQCELVFNTSSLQLHGVIHGKGEVMTTSKGTEIAVFTFHSISLGPEVTIKVVGQRALGLVSRTSIVINTTIDAVPGTLGGMQGGGSVGRYYPEDILTDHPRSIIISQLSEDRSIITNNVNGPGSNSLLVTSFMVKSEATHLPEVQMIQTRAAKGQTLSGGFVLHYKNYSTTVIPHDISSKALKLILEENLNIVQPLQSSHIHQYTTTIDRDSAIAGIGLVTVSRRLINDEEGYSWKITFQTAIGNIDALKVTSYLNGINATVNVTTIVDGNDISGHFILHVNNISTDPIASNVTAKGLETILMRLPNVSTAMVTRTDPTGNCDDGLCSNGPFPSHGYVWTCLITINSSESNITPVSPTSGLAGENDINILVTVNGSRLTGHGVSIHVIMDTANSPDDLSAALYVNRSFSLSYGGGGGSYGGFGGRGYGGLIQSLPYNDRYITDLLGGSGGAMRSSNPYEINRFMRLPHGRGGSGGGAIEIVAANDIIIGSFGKIIMSGGNAGQSSYGGAGGGSGGSILLASEGVCYINGILDVSGGDGSFGWGNSTEQGHIDGGGGSGGRIAVYAQSITLKNEEYIRYNGGRCGRWTRETSECVYRILANITIGSLLPLLSSEWKTIAELFIKQVLVVNSINIEGTTEFTFRKISLATSQVTITVPTSQFNQSLAYPAPICSENRYLNDSYLNNNRSYADRFEEVFIPWIGTQIAGVRLFELTITNVSLSPMNGTIHSYPSSCSNHGSNGSFYTEAKLYSTMYVGETTGAEGTNKALFIRNREYDQTVTGSIREAVYTNNGPTISFPQSQPTRITYYIRISSENDGYGTKSNYGALFSLFNQNQSSSSLIGVFIGYQIMHGANFYSQVDENTYLKRMKTLNILPAMNRWYKINIRIKWYSDNTGLYSISIDDTMMIIDQSFQGSSIDSISLTVIRSIDVWIDEIYVGFDNTMEFQCPQTNRSITYTSQPKQQSWSFQESHGSNSNGYTTYHTMKRHYNDLSTVGSLPLDGQGMILDHQDIKVSYPTGDYRTTSNQLHAGSLIYITNSTRTSKIVSERTKTLVTSLGLWYQGSDGASNKNGAGDGRYFHYIEYSYSSNLTNTLNGGIGACSSQDLMSWRFEGIVFHYINLTDMIHNTNESYYIERPKVLYNSRTSSYVLWGTMDTIHRQYALSVILSSSYEDGPFYFRRSFYPDGNHTRDQIIYPNPQSINNEAVIARTYYGTVEYILPEAIMQPVWESVKDRSTGKIDYRANYHRAWYNSGYDNYNDIYLQRWRGEDQSWNVTCVNKITGVIRNVPYGTYTSSDTICQEPNEYKITYGQGQPSITSRFVSPENYNYSWWRPTSVPGVQSQPWSNNYQDGYCGIRQLNDGFDNIYDSSLSTFTPLDRSACSNIADNPIFTTLQDKLIGILKITSTRRAKYLAVSQLTLDYLDTTGQINTVEGEYETGRLITLITELGQFGISISGENVNTSDSIQSTYLSPQRPPSNEFDTAIDYQTRFYQYVYNYNDRANYSLACVLDGNCPVNFKNQITIGNT